jgi:hypothetical protein
MQQFQREDFVCFSPLGSGLDDWPRLNALIAAEAAAAKRRVVLLPGTYNTATPCAPLPSGTRIHMGPNVRIVSTITPSGGPNPINNVFFATIASSGTSAAITATTTPGFNQVSVAAIAGPGGTVVNGSWIILGAQFRQEIYQVIAAPSGGGPYVLTLDRPVPTAWTVAMGAGFSLLSSPPPSDILIEGEGATISGTGNQAFEFFGALRARVTGFKVDGSAGNFTGPVFCWDTASRLCIAEDCHFAHTHGTQGLSMEGAEACEARRCDVSGYDLAGFNIQNAYACKIDHCRSANNYTTTGPSGTNYFLASQNTPPGEGCVDCAIVDSISEGDCANHAAIWSCIGPRLERFTLRGGSHNLGAQNGITVAGCTAAKISDSRIYGGYSWIAVSSSIGTVITGLDVDPPYDQAIASSTGFTFYSEVTLIGCRIMGQVAWSAMTLDLPAGELVNIIGCDLGSRSGYGAVEVTGTAPYIVNIQDTTFRSLVGSSYAIVSINPAAVICATDISGIGYDAGGLAFSMYFGAPVRLGGRVDFPGVGTILGASGYYNRGTVTLNGATVVPYLFPDLKGTDTIQLSRKTAGGTPGIAPTYTTTLTSILTGTVDLTTLTYPADFGTKTIAARVDGTYCLVTFANPANAAAVVAAINARILAVCGSQKALASLNGSNYLIITNANTSGVVTITDGTLLAATIGHVSGANGCRSVNVTGTALDTSAYAIDIS